MSSFVVKKVQLKMLGNAFFLGLLALLSEGCRPHLPSSDRPSRGVELHSDPAGETKLFGKASHRPVKLYLVGDLEATSQNTAASSPRPSAETDPLGRKNVPGKESDEFRSEKESPLGPDPVRHKLSRERKAVVATIALVAGALVVTSVAGKLFEHSKPEDFFRKDSYLEEVRRSRVVEGEISPKPESKAKSPKEQRVHLLTEKVLTTRVKSVGVIDDPEYVALIANESIPSSARILDSKLVKPIGTSEKATAILVRDPQPILKDLEAKNIDFESLAASGGSMAVGGHTISDVAKIGAGGFGSAYALKIDGMDLVAKVAKAKGGDEVENVSKEIQALRRFSNHPHIISYYGEITAFARDGRGQRIIFLERGKMTLNELIKDYEISPAARRQIALDLLGGLDHLHEDGSGHFDVKPSNIVIAWDGSAKLIDLGAVRKFGHQALGTKVYKAPGWGQTGEDINQGGKLDSYAIGLTLLEMHFPEKFSAKELKKIRGENKRLEDMSEFSGFKEQAENSGQDSERRIIYDLLRYDSKDRITVKDALERFEKLSF